MLESTFNYKDFLKTSAKGLDPADKQMAFQGIMSDSAHQREIADLRAAGLNPVLSAQGGSGASSPSGAYDAEQEAKDLMSVMSQAVGGISRVADKAIDNSAKAVDNTVSKLVSADISKRNVLGYSEPVSSIDYSGRFFKPALRLINARPMDVKAHPNVTGRSLASYEGRVKANRMTFEDMKRAYTEETGRKWYDSRPYIGKLPTSLPGIVSMLDYVPKMFNSGYQQQKNWYRQNMKYWKSKMSPSEWKKFVYWASHSDR